MEEVVSNRVTAHRLIPQHVPDEPTDPIGTSTRRDTVVAAIALIGIACAALLRYVYHLDERIYIAPLQLVLATGGTYIVLRLLAQVIKLEFGSDLLAGVTIVTAAILGQYLAGAIIVLMFAGGQALESYATGHAASTLRALAKRMPSIAHRAIGTGYRDIAIADVHINDDLVLLPHEICPVDGNVVQGRGVMDESYLTGEPFQIAKAPGAEVLSGAINGETVLLIRARRQPQDSRYARISKVIQVAQQQRPHIRRLGDFLGAIYTPIALAIAVAAAIWSGDSQRFLAVVVIATPCPLLLGIPVAIICSISLCAKRAIIVRDPAVLEEACRCETVIFDKTGTLTYGRPLLTDEFVGAGFSADQVLQLAASLEQYSRHPLSEAVVRAAKSRKLLLLEATEISEPPGKGLCGTVSGQQLLITSRHQLSKMPAAQTNELPPENTGLECVVLVNNHYAATYQFHDEVKSDAPSFVSHLIPRHQVKRLLLVSGDRESEVRNLGQQMGITQVYASQTPEQKLDIVRRETNDARTLYIGDGINDAPALLTATAGIAIGAQSDITCNAAGAVVMGSNLSRVDEFLHISARMRKVALQSAVGGIAFSLIGMGFAAAGVLVPVAGAILQEIIDAAAVLNALRAAIAPAELTDYSA